MSLVPPTKVGKLQKALHAKAKGSPDYRFYALYDKVYRADVLWTRLSHLPINGGSPGVDGQTFEDIEEYGRRSGWTNWRKNFGRSGIVRRPCGRVHIPKPGKPGKQQTARHSDDQGSCCA